LYVAKTVSLNEVAGSLGFQFFKFAKYKKKKELTEKRNGVSTTKSGALQVILTVNSWIELLHRHKFCFKYNLCIYCEVLTIESKSNDLLTTKDFGCKRTDGIQCSLCSICIISGIVQLHFKRCIKFTNMNATLKHTTFLSFKLIFVHRHNNQ
jgi:hypothetical protein